MTDPSSEQKKVRYDRVLTDANEVFDLGWMNEELTERLFTELNFAPSECKSKFGFSSFTRWHRAWYEDAELYFASQYLLAYRDALSEIAATVDEEMPRDYYEDMLKENLWAFVSTELGKAWRATKQTDEAENRTHRWKISAKYIFSQHRLGKDDEVKTFLHLLHRIAIVNDVLNHRAQRHGLTYSRRKEGVADLDPITAFCDRVKDIVKSFAQMNGKVISTNAKGVAGQYVFKVDAQHFCLMMNELRTNYDYYLNSTFIPCFLSLFILLVTAFSLGLELKSGLSRQWLKTSGDSMFLALVGKLVPQTVLFTVVCWFVQWMMFRCYDFPLNCNPWNMLIAMFLLVVANQSFAVLMFCFVPNFRYGTMLCTLLGMVSFSFCGFSLPHEAMYPWVHSLGYVMPIKYYFLIMVDQALNGIDLYYSRVYYAALIGFTILPMLLSWRLKKECMNPVYVP